MNIIDIFRFNGPGTGVEQSALVGERIRECVSSTENNSTACWNANFPSFTTNTNNKYNTNVVRAVAALDESVKEGWIEAFHDCCRKKYTSHNCNAYRATDYESDLWVLLYDVYNRTYQPGKSICFCVKRPKVREIFAASFRDRIVQHWISLRLIPLFEQRHIRLGDRSYNCRVGYGTSYAVGSLVRDIELLSENYTKDAWVAKIDVRSFFMSIDVGILWNLLKPFIIENYKGDDIDTLLYLSEVTLWHRPQDNCERKGDLSLWDILPPHKSLFGNREGIGMAIGNITSQIWANFYMSYFLEEIMPWVESVGGRIGEFVDDFSFVAPRKEDCLEFRAKACAILKKLLNLTLNNDKFYIQHVSRGVSFVGQSIKPGRRHVSRKTMGDLVNSLRRLETECRMAADGGDMERVRQAVSSVNSYFGFTAETNDHRMKMRHVARECRDTLRLCELKKGRYFRIKNISK